MKKFIVKKKSIMANKDFFYKKEADAFFKRQQENLNDNIELLQFIVNWLKPFKKDIKKIVEIGCGNGKSLIFLSKKLEAKPFGIEPSSDAVNFIRKKNPNVEIINGFSDKLDLKDDYFDFVHLGFFLYLFDRKYYFRSLSEADRILKFGGFLSIIDFDTPYNKINTYKHNKNVKVFKLDNSKPFVSTGMYTLINKQSVCSQSLGFTKEIDERVSIQLLYKEPSL